MLPLDQLEVPFFPTVIEEKLMCFAVNLTVSNENEDNETEHSKAQILSILLKFPGCLGFTLINILFSNNS